MKNKHDRLAAGILALFLSTVAFAHDSKAPLTEARQLFLYQYEVVRAALASDDLAAAQKAAREISNDENAGNLAKAATLADAREAFKKLSTRALRLVKHQDGFFIAHCPMAKGGGGDWVQVTGKVNNPFFGKSMLTCGSIKATKGEPRQSQGKHH